MSPSRAGSSQSSSWRIFSLARVGLWPFSLQLEIENRQKTSWNFDFDFFSLNHSFKFLKHLLCYVFSYKLPCNWLELVIIMMLVEKIGNLIGVLKQNSARFQLKNWSVPAWLGSAWNFHSSGSLEPENSSSNSSLQFWYFCGVTTNCVMHFV